MTTRPQPPHLDGAQPRSKGCVALSFGIAIAWAIVTAVHGYSTWPHIPMDISATDPATTAAFEAVVRRHTIGHLAIGLIPLLATMPLVSIICRKRS